jgi:hypothetical protein
MMFEEQDYNIQNNYLHIKNRIRNNFSDRIKYTMLDLFEEYYKTNNDSIIAYNLTLDEVLKDNNYAN